MTPTTFGKYTLLERISHGGMAEVFKARTSGAAGFERVVAIKLLLPQMANDQEFVTMLIDEAKIAGQLSHANIAQIFDLGQIDGRYYIVQEYVGGRDLRVIVAHHDQRGERLPVAVACQILLKMCEGLDYAHNRSDAGGAPLNLVHRDISPQNVVVSYEGEVKLIDFGIAKAEGRGTRTLAGLVKGKFAYMSPEQIRGLPVDRRSDVFACGIVLHEMLSGRALFLRETDFETLKRARSAEIEPPSQHNPDVPPELDRIVLKALTRHVEERYQSAVAMRDDLWAFVRGHERYCSRSELSAWMRRTFAGGAGATIAGTRPPTDGDDDDDAPTHDVANPAPPTGAAGAATTVARPASRREAPEPDTVIEQAPATSRAGEATLRGDGGGLSEGTLSDGDPVTDVEGAALATVDDPLGPGLGGEPADDPLDGRTIDDRLPPSLRALETPATPVARPPRRPTVTGAVPTPAPAGAAWWWWPLALVLVAAALATAVALLLG